MHRVGDLRVDNDPYQAAYGDAWPSLMAWAGPGSEVDLPEYRLALRVTGAWVKQAGLRGGNGGGGNGGGDGGVCF